MMQQRLLHILASEWMVFGGCWASFNLLRGSGGSGESRRSRYLRFVFLAVTFLILFLERKTFPPIVLIVLCLIWGALSLKWAAPVKSARSGEFPFYRLLRLVV